jgi:hypothetical protein
MKIFLLSTISFFICFNWSCVNPFAPKLDTKLGTNLCTGRATIDDVFCTFKDAYAFKDTTLYGSLVAPDFMFSYRDYDHGIDVSWGRDDEMRSTYGLFQSTQSLSLIWNNIISMDTSGGRTTVIRGFNLTVTFNPADIERVDGYANLTFVRDEKSLWRLVHWRDESNY